MISPRLGLILLLVLVSLASLNAGVFATDWSEAGFEVWQLVVVLLLFDALCIVAAWEILRRATPTFHTSGNSSPAVPRIADLYEQAPCGHFAITHDGVVCHVNDTAIAWLGYTRDEVVGHSIADLVAPASNGNVPPAPAHDLELQLVRRDGSLLSGLFSTRVVPGKDGGPLFTSVLFVDITERKKSEERLAELSARLHAILSAATELAIVAYDLDGRITVFNAGAERMLGYHAGEMLGREGPWCIHVAAEIRARGERLQEQLSRPMRGFDVLVERARQGGHEEREWTYVRKDGSTLLVNLVVTGVRGDDDQLQGFLAIATDVTERRRAGEVLRTAHEQALSANQAKSNFLASLSHEIRTPLNGIIGMLELMQQTPVTAQQRGYLDTLDRSADTLLSLINDVLDISKVEAGKLDLVEAPFAPRQLAEQATSVVSAQAERKGLALACTIAPDVPPAVVGDAGRLRQVLLNLLANAVKFTERGEVTLQVSRVPDPLPAPTPVPGSGFRERERAGDGERGKALLRFEVTDTGIGIPEDRLGVIFEPFAQGDASTARTHGGTGLGLTISARLVERMGGRIGVVSTPGQGSTFAFTLALPIHESALPAIAEKPAEPAVPATAPARAIRVLLAEDNPVNQEVMTLLLQKAGYRVRLAANGEEALQAFEQDPCDIILMDLQMPGMDGLRATRLIRAREKAVGGHVPIVAVTANALSGERQRCLAAGMDDYLSKPVRGAELFPTIGRLVGTGAREPTPDRPAAEEQADWVAALTGMGFDHGAIARLARTFLDTVPPRMELLRQALVDGNATQVQVTAHSLKGSLAVFAAKEALEAAQRLETIGKAQQLDTGQDLLADLEVRVRPLVGAMNDYVQSAP